MPGVSPTCFGPWRKLVDNGQKQTPEFNKAVVALLPHVSAMKDQFKAQGIANLLWAMAKLVDNGLEPTPGLNEAVVALLPHVNAQKDQFKAQGIANLLWAMAKTGGQRAGADTRAQRGLSRPVAPRERTEKPT